MTWTTTDDADGFLSAAGPFLRARAAENTLLLTIAHTVVARGRRVYGDTDPRFGWWTAEDGTVAGAFLQTPPHPVLLTRTPDEAVVALAATLAADGGPLPGVNAGDDAARAFAAEWRKLTGAEAHVGRRSRLYRLGDLAAPGPAVPGRPRAAVESDRSLLLSWYEEFGREVGEVGHHREAVDDRLSYGGLTLWEVDGTPVSMAGATRPIAGMVRIAPVYTPVELRSRGYAGAVTAAVSQAAVEAGADVVVLFTDLANPTSNALYQRIGYRPVEDRTVLVFDGLPGHT